MNFVAQAKKGDAVRPYAVIDGEQNVVVRFEDYGKARSKARALNKRAQQVANQLPQMIWEAA